jgi:dTDP-4-amino-4,6-dideoxygalactose transaminase
LTAKDVQWGLHYPIPVHLQPAHADLGYRKGDFPHSEAAAAELLSLPMFPELTEQQLRDVASAVREATGGRG